MNDVVSPDAYGALIEPATLKMQRLLPGPIERVWAYLTKSDLRRQWLAAGGMEPRVGASFELVWRNDELTDPPGVRPAGFDAEHRMRGDILAYDPPRRLAFTFHGGSEVTFELEPRGEQVMLTLVHRRLPDRRMLLGVSAGWHAHLDLMASRLSGADPLVFWDEMSRLRMDYDRRLPA